RARAGRAASRARHPAAPAHGRSPTLRRLGERDPHGAPQAVPRRADHRRELPRGRAGDHQPLADERRRCAPPHRLRERSLAGSVRSHRAGHQQGLPAVAREHRGLRPGRNRPGGSRVVRLLTLGAVLGIIGGIVELVLTLYVLVLIARLVLDYIPLFNRQWRPKGVGLVLAELAYTLTDPPFRFFRRLVPPLRLGTISLDFGFALTMLVVLILMSIVRALT